MEPTYGELIRAGMDPEAARRFLEEGRPVQLPRTITKDSEALWNSIKVVASKFPRHSMDLFVMALEKNTTALKSVFAEIRADVDELERLLDGL